MNKHTKKVEYTFEEFQKKFYPQPHKQQITRSDNPRETGIRVARETLNKLKYQTLRNK